MVRGSKDRPPNGHAGDRLAGNGAIRGLYQPYQTDIFAVPNIILSDIASKFRLCDREFAAENAGIQMVDVH